MHNSVSSATDQQRQALRRITDVFREMIDDSVTLDASGDQLEQIAERLEAIAGDVKKHSGEGRMLEYYNPHYQGCINSIQPYSAFCGHFNPLAAPLEISQQDNKTLGEVNFGIAYEGPPHCVHGGIISGVYDQLMAIAGMSTGKAGPTAYLNVEYHRPTPLYSPLEFQAWISEETGNKITVSGQCLSEGKVLTTATALFITRKLSLKSQA